MHVAVTGASGCLGRAVLRHLLPGNGVRALFRRRDGFTEECERHGVHVVLGDLDDHGALAALVNDAEIVYHCAAAMGKGDLARSYRVNVGGTERLARAALAQGVGRFLYVSSISVYAATRRADHTITEDVEPQHVDRLNSYGRTKYLGEQVVRDLGERRGLPFTIVRPTNVYGPWSRPWFLQFQQMLKWNPFAIGNIPIDVVYVDDVVAAMAQAAVAPAARNETFHIGHELIALRQFIAHIGAVVGRRTRRFPDALDYLLRAMIERSYRVATRTHMSMSLVRPARYPYAKAQQAFGYAPDVRLREGFAAIAEWYRRDFLAG